MGNSFAVQPASATVPRGIKGIPTRSSAEARSWRSRGDPTHFLFPGKLLHPCKACRVSAKSVRNITYDAFKLSSLVSPYTTLLTLTDGYFLLSLLSESSEDGNFRHETFSRSPPWQLDLASGYPTRWLGSSETEYRHLPQYMCSNRRRYFGCSIEFVGRFSASRRRHCTSTHLHCGTITWHFRKGTNDVLIWKFVSPVYNILTGVSGLDSVATHPAFFGI